MKDLESNSRTRYYSSQFRYHELRSLSGPLEWMPHLSLAVKPPRRTFEIYLHTCYTLYMFDTRATGGALNLEL